MPDDVTVVHVVAGGLHPRAGGTSRVVVDITDALARQSDMSIVLLTQSVVNADTVSSACARVKRVTTQSTSRFTTSLGLAGRRELNRIMKAGHVALIHNHGMWQPINHWAASAARRCCIPSIIQPHGMLQPWALEQKAWKKKIGLALYQRPDLEAAKLLVATADAELENLRRLGLRQPIAVIPNGVTVASTRNPEAAPVTSAGKERIALFLSRVHPSKGLLNLVNAWGNVAPRGWKLRIYGPDEGGHLQVVMRSVKRLGIDDSVEYSGEVTQERKSAVYEGASLFILPSFSENFGVVVAEALAHGVPVITTRVTPWAGLLDYGCGWWIEPTANALTETLREALGKDAATLRAMGEQGRAYAKRFNWSHLAKQTEDAYRWVLGIGAKPECVFLD